MLTNKSELNVTLVLVIELKKIKLYTGDTIAATRYFRSTAETILNEGDIRGVVHKAKSKILERIEQFTNEGSEWRVKRLLSLDLNTAKYQPFQARSYCPRPKYVKQSIFR